MQIQNNAQPRDVSQSTDPTASATSALPSNVDGLANENTFLQLLVAQIKNQDPMSPTDGVQFLTQLAQFQQLEQSMNSGQDLTAIRTDLEKLVQARTAETNN